MSKIKVTFVETNCKKNGPIKQTLNIIRNMDKEVFEPSLVTVWPEDADNSMIDEYKKLGIPVLSANMSKKKSVLFGKKEVGQLLEQLQPDIVQGVGMPPYRMTLGYKRAIHFVTLRNYCYETFKAHIEAGDPKQKMIEATVQSYGLTIAGTLTSNGICAVSTLERIYDKFGQNVLDRTLRLAVATWEGETNSFSGNMLMGIARIVVAYGDSLKDDVFKDHVGRVSVKSIIRTAKERRPGALGFSEAMMLAYNNKNKYRLSLRTLYGGRPSPADGPSEDEFEE